MATSEKILLLMESMTEWLAETEDVLARLKILDINFKNKINMSKITETENQHVPPFVLQLNALDFAKFNSVLAFTTLNLCIVLLRLNGYDPNSNRGLGLEVNRIKSLVLKVRDVAQQWNDKPHVELVDAEVATRFVLASINSNKIQNKIQADLIKQNKNKNKFDIKNETIKNDSEIMVVESVATSPLSKKEKKKLKQTQKNNNDKINQKQNKNHQKEKSANKLVFKNLSRNKNKKSKK